MLQIAIKKRIFKINYCFYFDGIQEVRESGLINIYVQSKIKGNLTVEFLTSHIDLKLPETTLWNLISKSFQNEIRKAEKDGWELTIIEAPTDKEILEFKGFFDNFARNKKIAFSDIDLMRALISCGSLYLIHIRKHDQKLMVYNAYIHDMNRVRLLYSSNNLYSHDNSSQVVGRNSKLLHWRAINHFKKNGFTLYDMGGLSTIDRPPHAQINKYKRSFGGRDVIEYGDIIFRKNFVGNIVKLIFDLKNRASKWKS